MPCSSEPRTQDGVHLAALRPEQRLLVHIQIGSLAQNVAQRLAEQVAIRIASLLVRVCVLVAQQDGGAPRLARALKQLHSLRLPASEMRIATQRTYLPARTRFQAFWQSAMLPLGSTMRSCSTSHEERAMVS